jgi:hypothetical protein
MRYNSGDDLILLDYISMCSEGIIMDSYTSAAWLLRFSHVDNCWKVIGCHSLEQS